MLPRNKPESEGRYCEESYADKQGARIITHLDVVSYRHLSSTFLRHDKTS